MWYCVVLQEVADMAKRRPSGEGMIRLKKKGQWEGRIVVGHISSETTLNIYTHITDNMQRSAADKIERGFGRNEGALGEDGQTPDRAPETPVRAKFEPKQPKIRRPGTGCIFRINEKKW